MQRSMLSVSVILLSIINSYNILEEKALFRLSRAACLVLALLEEKKHLWNQHQLKLSLWLHGSLHLHSPHWIAMYSHIVKHEALQITPFPQGKKNLVWKCISQWNKPGYFELLGKENLILI